MNRQPKGSKNGGQFAPDTRGRTAPTVGHQPNKPADPDENSEAFSGYDDWAKELASELSSRGLNVDRYEPPTRNTTDFLVVSDPEGPYEYAVGPSVETGQYGIASRNIVVDPENAWDDETEFVENLSMKDIADETAKWVNGE